MKPMRRVPPNWGMAPRVGVDLQRVPPNWGLAPRVGDDDLLFDPDQVQKVTKLSRADQARALGVPLRIFNAHYSDSYVERMNARTWNDYRKVLRNRGQQSEVRRLSNLRNIYKEKQKCPGKWNPKTGCRDREWYMKARDTGQKVLDDVASSPITSAALTVASFTPLAPIAVPVSVGLQTANQLAQGRGLNVEGLSRIAAAKIGVPPGAIPVASSLGRLAQGDLDVADLAGSAALAAGANPDIVRAGRAAAAGDVEGLSAQAAAAVGVPPGAVRITTRAARGDWRGAATSAAKELGAPSVAGLSRQAAAAVGVPEGAVPVARALARGDVGRATSRAARAVAPTEYRRAESGLQHARKVRDQARAAKKAARDARRKVNSLRRGKIRAAAGRGLSSLPGPPAGSSLSNLTRGRW